MHLTSFVAAYTIMWIASIVAAIYLGVALHSRR